MALQVLQAHMTELQAVNQMLRSIGEQPVQQLDGSQIDSEQAYQVLLEESRRIQSMGWHCNTRRGVTLTADDNNQFIVSANILSVDTVNPDSPRRTASPNYSSIYNTSVRRNSSDDNYVLYDIDNDTDTWANGPDTLTVDIIEYLEYDNLSPLLQIYIYKSAAHIYQKTSMQSQVLFQFTQEDVQSSMNDALQEDARTADRNMFLNHRPAWEIVYRYNPLYGS